jgi:hypothetical protein
MKFKKAKITREIKTSKNIKNNIFFFNFL